MDADVSGSNPTNPSPSGREKSVEGCERGIVDGSRPEPCRQCRVEPGEAHEDGCGVARCMLTGQQRIQHDCADHCDTCNCVPCPPDIWTGEWPGVAECSEFGWWSYFGPDHGEGPGWKRCTDDHPGAGPDLNRLVIEARWDADAKRWVKP